MNRQSIIVILIGAIASLAGFATFDYLRGRRCAELQGIWEGATRTCRLSSGETTGTVSVLAVAGGLLVAVALGFMMYRVLLYAMGRARTSGPM